MVFDSSRSHRKGKGESSREMIDDWISETGYKHRVTVGYYKHPVSLNKIAPGFLG